MDPKTFTLANMFAMQLHNFKDEVGAITSAAVKELTIRQHRELFEAVRMKNPRSARKISASMIEGVEQRLAGKHSQPGDGQ